jgi:hypothetical protein
MTKTDPNTLFDQLGVADHIPDEMLLEAHALLDQALHLGVLLGTRGDMLRSWAASHLFQVEGALIARGVEIPGKNHTGLRPYRLASNPDEQVFADQWKKVNKNPSNLLDHLLADNPNGQCQAPAELRDKLVAATVVQWLGSPVGQGFLRDCGYTKKDER